MNSISLQILKKSQFTLKRRKGKPDEFEAEDWICPNTPDLNDSSSYDKNSSFRVISFDFNLIAILFEFDLLAGRSQQGYGFVKRERRS